MWFYWQKGSCEEVIDAAADREDEFGTWLGKDTFQFMVFDNSGTVASGSRKLIDNID